MQDSEQDYIDPDLQSECVSALESYLSNAFDMEYEVQDDNLAAQPPAPEEEHPLEFKLFVGQAKTIKLEEEIIEVVVSRPEGYYEWDSEEEEEVKQRLASVLITQEDILAESKRPVISDLPVKVLFEEKTHF
jgi:hypothetical protein